MLKRTLSTLILWGLVAACVIFLGGSGAVWLLALLAALTLNEFYGLVAKMGIKPFKITGIALSMVIMLAPAYLEPEYGIDAGLILAFSAIVFAIRILRERDQSNRVETLGWSLFGLVYVPFMLQFLVKVLMMDSVSDSGGMMLVIWLIAAAKFCDTGALLTGLAIGRHKMSPVISPKKTWEGAAGGILISALVSAGIAWLWGDYLPVTMTPLVAALMALPIAALAIVSDLIESVIKRRADIKDTGQTIPGIGGFFDLSDSLILTAPLGWFLFQLL
jgi:phosphatidate cytidylyltransferase